MEHAPRLNVAARRSAPGQLVRPNAAPRGGPQLLPCGPGPALMLRETARAAHQAAKVRVGSQSPRGRLVIVSAAVPRGATASGHPGVV
ncbi:hypothetical protein NDU88_001314 [Pleurodeles waltl]|uniref:Uncharacterized protein n=1 Tax=Pleurodeles waltl TaxID=8319 RepID=A0AAV7P3C4_PLEWA|nr:hypothetical protein NDU88_001314 [Pleurodeles waltl]